MIVVGITGGMGSGKSTVAFVFAAAGIQVFDADCIVHETYASPPASLTRTIPEAMFAGIVDRGRLAAAIEVNPDLLTKIEAITRPIVLARAQSFLEDPKRIDNKIAALDVPLLFESGLDSLCDYTIVTIAPAEIRRKRVGDRQSMSAGLFRRLVERQMPDQDKMAKADYVVDTSVPHAEMEHTVRNLIKKLTGPDHRS